MPRAIEDIHADPRITLRNRSEQRQCVRHRRRRIVEAPGQQRRRLELARLHAPERFLLGLIDLLGIQLPPRHQLGARLLVLRRIEQPHREID